MSDIGVIAYQAVYSSFPTARVQIRVKGSETPIDALCPSVGAVRATGEFGTSADPGVLVRMLSTAVPASGMALGDAVTLTDSGGSNHELRINERHESGGIVRFMMAAKHG
jgi:hypothetical protein